MQQLRTQHVAVQLPALEQNGDASALQASVLLNPLSKARRWISNITYRLQLHVISA